MSKEYNVKLQKKLEDYLEAEGLSQAKAAPILGISAAVLSQYRRSDSMTRAILGRSRKSWKNSSGSRKNRARTAGRRSPSEPASRIHPYIHIGSGLQVDPLLSA